MEIKLLGLIGGEGVASHSLSPKMWNHVLKKKGIEAVYLPFEVERENLKKAIEGARALNILAANVTVPHKVEAISLLDDISDNARAAGAVNTIINLSAKLIGENTDVLAAKALVGKLARNKKILILGAGGAARAVLAALGNAKEIVIANRSLEHAEKLIQLHNKARAIGWKSIALEIADSQIIINCTPIGMLTPGTPVNQKLIRKDMLVVDFAYKQTRDTELIAIAKSKGCKTIDGKKLLAMQAAEAFRLVFNRKISVKNFEEGLK